MNPEKKQMKKKKERSTSNANDASTSTDLIKEIFTNMFKEQEEKLFNLVRNAISDTYVRFGRFTQEMSDSNTKSNN